MGVWCDRDVMQAGNTYFYQHHYQRASAFVAFLTGVACFTVKWVQQVRASSPTATP